MSFFRHKERIKAEDARRPIKGVDLPDDLIIKCPSCNRFILKTETLPAHTCPHCDHHFQFPAHDLITWLLDTDTFSEWDGDLTTEDNVLDFPNYPEKLSKAKETSGLKEAVVTGQGKLAGQALALGVMDNRFMMGSMGQTVGEKLTRLFERATEKGLAVVLYVTSGGARMQEGILSLMQMAKVTQAVDKHSQAGLFYCTVLMHPTTGGVSASFAMQADVILAEPQATVGFAGRRVIEQNIDSDLPEDFQMSEKVLDYGFIDRIVPRSDQADVLETLLKIHQ